MEKSIGECFAFNTNLVQWMLLAVLPTSVLASMIIWKLVQVVNRDWLLIRNGRFSKPNRMLGFGSCNAHLRHFPTHILPNFGVYLLAMGFLVFTLLWINLSPCLLLFGFASLNIGFDILICVGNAASLIRLGYLWIWLLCVGWCRHWNIVCLYGYIILLFMLRCVICIIKSYWYYHHVYNMNCILSWYKWI